MSEASRPIPFFKMHGQGNDFVILDRREGVDVPAPFPAASSAPLNPVAFAREVCRAHFGVGADGLVCIEGTADEPRMRMFNPDGSEAQTCGNALCCLARYLMEGTERRSLTIGTAAGPVPLTWTPGDPFPAEVAMGTPRFEDAVLPEPGQGGLRRVPIQHADGDLREVLVHPVSMGNPHAILYADELPPGTAFARLAPHLTASPVFPEGANASLLTIAAPDSAEIVVHERGAGWTLACGSAACAALASGLFRSRLESPTTLTFPGGAVRVRQDGDGDVHYAGNAQLVFTGVWMGA